MAVDLVVSWIRTRPSRDDNKIEFDLFRGEFSGMYSTFVPICSLRMYEQE
jgi:hypothetical protein